jgi:putative heme-binding domain-containing protein
MMRIPTLGVVCLTLLCKFLWITTSARSQELDQQLLRQPLPSLAQKARAEGDAARGAILFHQPHLACIKCHSVRDVPEGKPGPELTKLGAEIKAEHLVESILAPYKTIRKGFESLQVELTDGRTISGLVVKQEAEALELRDADGRVHSITATDIESKRAAPLSLMPIGLANMLANEGQFLDLVKYVIEVHEGGAKRAKELQPAASLLVLTVPEYENQVDHAGLIRSWNQESYQRGEKIYKRLCINCHGTKDSPGSLPTSLRFASGAFKNGADPHAMYRTLTYGMGQMTPQTWMVPRQKYDVIHYIREAYLKPHNPSQHFAVHDEYLARLPKGDTKGPEPSTVELWSQADYGTFLMGTYESPMTRKPTSNRDHSIAYKGIAIRLDSGPGGVAKGNHWALYEHDTMRLAGLWSAEPTSKQRFIDYQGIMFDGQHGAHPKTIGEHHLSIPDGPAWENPSTGKFDDQRIEGRDGRRYGPLPKEHVQFKGLYQFGQQVVLAYQVGRTSILEASQVVQHADGPVFLRTLRVGPRTSRLNLHASFAGDSAAQAQMLKSDQGVVPYSFGNKLDPNTGVLIEEGRETVTFTLAYLPKQKIKSNWRDELAPPQVDFDALTQGGPSRWPEVLETQAAIGDDGKPFVADVLTDPVANPWFCQLRFTGLDFLPGGDRLAACTWDGDVWIVSGLKGLEQASDEGKKTAPLKWKRIASGLFQPLGLKWINNAIHLTCRDQLVVLRDLNGDEETDFYECLNSDHQVTEHFHEFAMGLQTDAEGNFYYAKSARHALKAVVPHHGTLIKVSKDGKTTEILARGFRAANGVCLNPDSSFVVTDQEGHWNPKNRINWVKPGGFYGNMFGYHDVTDSSDSAMQQPLCWITNAYDRSPAELLWVPKGKFGPIEGSLLNLSYGYGKVFLVPFEKNEGNDKAPVQGGMIELPLQSFPTGLIRGRFSDSDDALYACGMYSWAGSVTQPGGLYRIRYTGKPVRLPKEIHAKKDSLVLTFTDAIEPNSVKDLKSLEFKTWALKRTDDYGSKHYDEKVVQIDDAEIGADGKTLTLKILGLKPTWSYSLNYSLKGSDGVPFSGLLHGTIHEIK